MVEAARIYFVDVYRDRVVCDAVCAGVRFEFDAAMQHLKLSLGPVASLRESQDDSIAIILRDPSQLGLLKTLSIEIKAGAHLHCGLVDIHANQHISISEGASLSLISTSFRDEKSEVHLTGKGAKIEVRGLMEGHEKARLSYHLSLYHEADETESKIEVRGIADDQSCVAFTGFIHVAPNIKKVVADLQTPHLLLSSRARIDAKPELEIYSDEVICHHGASVGNIDQNALFYLESRGFLRSDARLLLVDSFRKSLFKVPSLISDWMRSHVEGSV